MDHRRAIALSPASTTTTAASERIASHQKTTYIKTSTSILSNGIIPKILQLAHQFYRLSLQPIQR